MKAALLLLLLATPAAAQPLPDYSDNRTTAADVIQSLYNAVNRHEYLRAWSYYRDGAAPNFPTFAAGYANTFSVEVQLGKITQDGTAGATHYAVPVALRARDSADHITVFEGCYTLIQVDPSIQQTPPFRPIQIDGGRLQKTAKSFPKAMGTCN